MPGDDDAASFGGSFGGDAVGAGFAGKAIERGLAVRGEGGERAGAIRRGVAAEERAVEPCQIGGLRMAVERSDRGVPSATAIDEPAHHEMVSAEDQHRGGERGRHHAGADPDIRRGGGEQQRACRRDAGRRAEAGRGGPRFDLCLVLQHAFPSRVRSILDQVATFNHRFG